MRSMVEGAPVWGEGPMKTVEKADGTRAHARHGPPVCHARHRPRRKTTTRSNQTELMTAGV
jgi:hypothetical protein